MASNLLSRLLPSASDEAYEVEPLNHPARRQSSSTDEHHDMDVDEENLEARFEAQDLENLLADASSSQMTIESTAVPPQNAERAPPGINTTNRAAAWRQPPSARPPPLDDDDDVPQSLLLEDGLQSPISNRTQPIDGLPPPVPGPSTRQNRAQWETTRRQQRLHDEGQRNAQSHPWGQVGRPGHYAADPKEKALWLWVNQTDLDNFLADVYEYYVGCGMYSIILRTVLTLMQTAFVVIFVTSLWWCIDYSKLSNSSKLSQIIVPKCMKK